MRNSHHKTNSVFISFHRSMDLIQINSLLCNICEPINAYNILYWFFCKAKRSAKNSLPAGLIDDNGCKRIFVWWYFNNYAFENNKMCISLLLQSLSNGLTDMRLFSSHCCMTRLIWLMQYSFELNHSDVLMNLTISFTI